MQFFKLLAAAATVAVAVAKVQITNTAAQLTGIAAGKPLKITWIDATGPITLKLKSGPSTAQVFVEDITTGASGGSFTWTPESTLPDATYNLEIDDGADVNYSVQFEITGGTGNPSTLGSTVTSAASTSGTSSSSAAASTSASTTGSSASSTGSSSSKSSSSTSSSSGSSSSSATSASSTASVPTSVPNSAVQNGSPFALVIMGALAIAGLN